MSAQKVNKNLQYFDRDTLSDNDIVDQVFPEPLIQIRDDLVLCHKQFLSQRGGFEIDKQLSAFIINIRRMLGDVASHQLVPVFTHLHLVHLSAEAHLADHIVEHIFQRYKPAIPGQVE